MVAVPESGRARPRIIRSVVDFPAPFGPRKPVMVSEATVKAHVSRLLTKLEAANRVQIAIVVHDASHS
jgi:hypothetical protein